MTNTEIPTKAIQTVLHRGFKPDGIENVTSFKATTRGGQTWVRWFNNDGQEVIQDIEHVIFDHQFAKLLWGEGFYRYFERSLGEADTSETYNLDELEEEQQWGAVFVPTWRYHIQQLAASDNRSEYLGEHIDGN